MLTRKAQICLILTLLLACIELEITCEILQEQKEVNMTTTEETPKNPNPKTEEEHLITICLRDKGLAKSCRWLPRMQLRS